MTTSNFDLISHDFKCTNSQCGNVFQQTYRSLLKADKIVCPKCGASEDIRESKVSGNIGLWFNTVRELDKLDKKK